MLVIALRFFSLPFFFFVPFSCFYCFFFFLPSSLFPPLFLTVRSWALSFGKWMMTNGRMDGSVTDFVDMDGHRYRHGTARHGTAPWDLVGRLTGW